MSGAASIANYNYLPPLGINTLDLPVLYQLMANAANNLNVPFVIGIGEGGIDSIRNPFKEEILKFQDEAAGTIYFNDGDEAFAYLKRVIASGHPVGVFLDGYYIYDDTSAVSDWWKSFYTKKNSGWNMVVTGYDNEHVYTLFRCRYTI